MPRRFTRLDDPGFLEMFAKIRRSWFRLETLQTYPEEDGYSDWLAGAPIDLRPGPWQAMIRANRTFGRQMSRVHVIEEPISDYVEYELAIYQLNIDAGEEVRLIPVRGGTWPKAVPRQDYWLFDNTELWVMQYDHDGFFVACEHQPDPEAVAASQRARDAAMPLSVSVADYGFQPSRTL